MTPFDLRRAERMLRSEHAIAEFDFVRREVYPDRLRSKRDDHYLAAADSMLQVYRRGLGKTRQQLHRQIEELLEDLEDCPPRRVAAFCKLLDQLSQFNQHRGAAELRRRVFTFSAPRHPIVARREGIFENSLETVRQQLAAELKLPWSEIAGRLFSDVIELQTLRSFDASCAPRDLLSLYNLSQTQAALYRATRMRIDATEDMKTILRHAKLAGLMHRISRLSQSPPRYRFEFDGAQSVLRQTWRYGIRFARLLPKLLACRGWQLSAHVAGPDKRSFLLRVSPQDGLRSPLKPPEDFDSQLEQRVFEAWQQQPVAGWTLERESEVLHWGQTVLTPDFVLREVNTQRQILVEVVGFWTPEYLREKSDRLQQFVRTPAATEASGKRHWLLLLAREEMAAKLELPEDLPIPHLVIGGRMQPRQWIEAAID